MTALVLVRWLVRVIAGVTLLFGVGLIAVRQAGVQTGVLVPLMALAPYAIVLGALAVLLFVLTRDWIATGIAGVVLLAAVCTQLPLWRSDGPPIDTVRATPLVVMAANLLGEQAHPDAVVAAVQEQGVQLLMLEELSAPQREALHDAGLDALLPYSVAQPEGPGNPGGTGIWSSYPLTSGTTIPGFAFNQVVAKLDLPGDGIDPTVVAVHPVAAGVSGNETWLAEQQLLRRHLAGITGPAIVGGDFNATLDHPAFRDYLADGWHDAVDESGAGLVRTWPVDRPFPFPLFGIDHVLTRGGPVAVGAESHAIPDSDHRALVAHLLLPGTP